MPRFARSLFAVLALALCLPCAALAQAPSVPCQIKAEFPHDPDTFTQGLFIENGRLYESSGGYGVSFVAEVDLKTGKQLKRREVEPRLFAEGMAPSGSTIRLLTWRSGTGLLFALDDLAPQGTFDYRVPTEHTEGWGLTFDGARFILSSGSDMLHFHQAEDFSPTGGVRVHDGNRAVRQLNELEYVEGLVLANIWKRDEIAVVDPSDGAVTAWIDLAPLRARIAPGSGVANGIAYDRETGRLFVTGKNWDKLFEIEPELDAWEPAARDRE